MSRRVTRRILFLVFVFSVIIIVIVIAFKGFSSNHFEDEKIETEYGDIFNITYDKEIVKSTIRPSVSTDPNPDSRFYIILGGKVTKDDFVGLKKTEQIKVYRVCNVAIFADPTGYKALDDDLAIDNYPEAADAVIHSILSNERFFKRNMIFLLKSTKYREEAKRIMELVRNEEYEELSVYGLTKETINDTQKLNYIKQAAEDALNENKHIP